MNNKEFPEQEEEFFPEDTQEVIPEEPSQPEHELLTNPVLGEEITADEHAMAWHGMTHPAEPEQEFDMDFLSKLTLFFRHGIIRLTRQRRSRL